MEYNGYKNKATWNVALWLDNDYSLYQAMRDFANETVRRLDIKSVTYRRFIRHAGLQGQKTPDGFKFDGKALDYSALTELIRESVG